MKRRIKLTESELSKIVKRIINESKGGLPCVVQGDGLCPIYCEIKVAKRYCPKSDEVREIQHALAKLGMYKGEGGGMSKRCAENSKYCDGIFDWRTESAVKEFQKSVNLTTDGVVGFDTINELLGKRECNCEQWEQNPAKDNDQQQNFLDNDFKDGYSYHYLLKYIDCDELKDCLRKTAQKRSWDDIFNCILKKVKNKYPRQGGFQDDGSKKTSGCPAYINCMPGSNKKLHVGCNSMQGTSKAYKEFWAKCPNTKIAR